MDFPSVYGESVWEYLVMNGKTVLMTRRENRYDGRIVYVNGV